LPGESPVSGPERESDRAPSREPVRSSPMGEPEPPSPRKEERRLAQWLAVPAVTAGAILIVVGFNPAVFLFFFLPPVAGFFWVALVGTFFLWWHARSSLRGTPDELARRIRLQRPRTSVPWLAGMVVCTFLVMAGVVSLVQLATGPIDLTDSPFHQDVLAFADDLPGWIVFTFAAAVVIPIIEEFAFRGRLQGFLEPRWGRAPAVLFAAALFSVIHAGGPHLLLLTVPLIMGIFLGVAVVLSQSIWAAVLLHGAWNGTMAVMARTTSPVSRVGEETYLGMILPSSLALIVVGFLGWMYLVRSAGEEPLAGDR